MEAGKIASEPEQNSLFSRLVSDIKRSVTGNDLGAFYVIVGLVAIWAFFYFANSRFLSGANITNLGLQIVPLVTISMGVVLVLLLGEIDLSVGAVSGFTAAVMAVMNVKHGVSPVIAILAALAVGALIGLIQGFWAAQFGVPSFVVTLAGLLGWQGALLYILGGTGTVNLTDSTIIGLANTFLARGVGWLVGVVALLVFIALRVRLWRRQVRAGANTASAAGFAIRMALVVVGTVVLIAVFNGDRGVPLAILIMLGLLIALDIMLRTSRFGRYVFAVGGNVEAALRAGISVKRIKVGIFVIATALAAAGGIMAASRLYAVNQQSGAGVLLLNAIAAAVIGGTSLFGGRGSVWSALLGGLVIGSISNGMDLLAVSAAVKYMITAVVLLLAATIDGLSRRGQVSTH